ncbi:sensor histidine kinase [Cryptosporangium phraense]|uniref:Signal transduction histidine-protein kinase/phosphatase MprB n=1 Tax=Cryptosporangium phraense TaxID=2593070 RepID=A0A545AUF1_9ACTN|nr:HAMP domain-containing sensor histidine kinase [Cryptosporangium phraense]TQS44967.1 HAMP domain-containing histidine kinase [Cryptosporangium phraense]
MRRALALVALATTSMVSLAFVVPLLLVVHQIARDRAITDAQRQANAAVSILAATNDLHERERALATVPAWKQDGLAIHIPGQATLGTTRAKPADIKTVRTGTDESTTAGVDGGVVYLLPTQLAQPTSTGEDTAVIEVFVPSEALSRGVAGASLALIVVAIGLVVGSVVVADRLAAKVVGATRNLAAVARAFGDGNLDARVEPSGPRELSEAGFSFNTMADRVVATLDAERELAADLSHRLRTPLTALRLDAEALDDGVDAARMREAVATLEREVDIIIQTARRPLSERGPEWCDLAEVVAERVDFWGALAEDEGRDFRLAGVGRRVPVAVSRTELVSIVDVLLGNVFRHTAPGVAFAVSVLVLRGPVAALVVEDAGTGIKHPRMAVRRGNSGGGSTGLGLDIVRRVAETAGGSIRIDISPMGGARIRVDLAMLDPAVFRNMARGGGPVPDREEPWPDVPRGAGDYRPLHRAVGALRAMRKTRVNSRSERP